MFRDAIAAAQTACPGTAPGREVSHELWKHLGTLEALHRIQRELLEANRISRVPGRRADRPEMPNRWLRFTIWDQADPGKGHAVKAEQWQESFPLPTAGRSPPERTGASPSPAFRLSRLNSKTRIVPSAVGDGGVMFRFAMVATLIAVVLADANHERGERTTASTSRRLQTRNMFASRLTA